MENKELKVVVNVYHNVEVDAEKVKIDMMNRISNPIVLDKYVNFWEHSRECLDPLSYEWRKYNKELDDMYNNICKRLKNRYTKEEKAYVRYYFSEDNQTIVIEVSKINILMHSLFVH